MTSPAPDLFRRPLARARLAPVLPGLACIAALCITALPGYLYGYPGNALSGAAIALLGGYMAMNIGANDAANSVGPLVGARALPTGPALLLAAGAGSAGALLAGEQTTGRIAFGIIAPGQIHDPATFISGMIAALAAAALWVNIMTLLRAPVSTTHAVIGGIVGFALFIPLARIEGPESAGTGLFPGSGILSWREIGIITLGWFVSPVASALTAAAILAFLKRKLLGAHDKIRAARFWIPVLVAAMAALFTLFLLNKGLQHVWQVPPPVPAAAAIAAFIATMALAGPYFRRVSAGLANRNQTIRKLFRVPLIIAGGFLAFSHGANDIANVAGPVTAILHVQATSGHTLPALSLPGAGLDIPVWTTLLGAFGLAAGLLLFGGGMVRLVASRITRINPVRASAITMATAATVTLASWIALPVSTTQIAVGAVLGVGIYREIRARKPRRAQSPRKRKRRLLRRGDSLRILLAWTLTFPASAALSALLFRGLESLH